MGDVDSDVGVDIDIIVDDANIRLAVHQSDYRHWKYFMGEEF